MWWAIAWNLIKGDIPGIARVFTDYLGKKDDNATARLTKAVQADKEVAIAQIQASAQTYRDRTDFLKGMKVTQWLIAAALIPPIYHMGGVFLDSCPFFVIPYYYHVVGSWNFVALPKPYDQYEWQLVASLLGINTTLSVGMGIAKALIKR